MKTALLDISSWDLVLDAAGNIAVASEPYALAQDVASAIKLFLGECWYDTTRGIPYFSQILGQTPSIDVFQDAIVQAALTVPGLVSAQCIISAFEGRTITGSVPFVDDKGVSQTVNFSG